MATSKKFAPYVGAQTLKGKSIEILDQMHAFPGIRPILWRPGTGVHPDLFPLFARPCPKTPRHGFVDSRKVYNIFDIERAYKETIEADPEGELFLMSILDGEISSIVTPTNMTFGYGRDGATSGTSNMIPVPGNVNSWDRYLDKEYPGASTLKLPNETLYMEMVTHEEGQDYKLYPVQLRSGPLVEAQRDWIPYTVTVKRTLFPYNYNTLLDWEAAIKTAVSASEEGTVAVCGGHSLSSHYCVHAIQNGIPCITTYQPRIGETITPNATKPVWNNSNYEYCANIIRRELGHQMSISKLHEYAALTAATIHSSHLWSNEPHLIKLIGTASAYLHKLIKIACAGEIRYYKENTNGRRANNETPRLNVWASALTEQWNWERAKAQLKAYEHKFANGYWEYGFGGRRWASVAKAAIAQLKAMKTFTQTPNEDNFTELVQKNNILMHEAHNSGTPMSKFFDEGNVMLDAIANLPQLGFINGITAHKVMF